MLHEFYFPFWYLQDLILIIFALAPVITMLLRNKWLSQGALLGLCALSCAGASLSWLNTSSILLFYIGGYLAVYKSSLIEKKWDKSLSFAAFVILAICCVIRYIGIPVLKEVCTYASPLLVWKVTDLIEFKKPKWFENQSFFIYVAHIIPVTIIGHLLKAVSSDPLWAASSYLIAIGITVLLLYVTAKMLYKVTPKFYKLICGGR